MNSSCKTFYLRRWSNTTSSLIISTLKLVSVLTIVATSNAFPMAAWNKENSPELMDNQYLRIFDKLPLEGQLTTLPWSDDYWPTYKGGISYRWNESGDNDQKKYSYKLLKKNKINPRLDTSSLSPAEKFDIYLGRYDFPLAQQERIRTNVMSTIPGSREYDSSFTIPTWEGLCHGWAPGSTLFKNPKPVTVTNNDGVVVKFGSSDVKALLIYFLHATNSKTYFLGSRCEIKLDELKEKVAKNEMSEEEMLEYMNSPECADTNAGAFHIALVNQLGFKNEGFVIDVVRDAEVWNHPLYAFKTKILNDRQGASEGAAAGTIREVSVETTVDYVVEVSQSWEYVKEHSGINTKIYKYRLEINAQGKIIGGEWEGEDRPDFIWKSERPEFQGYFAPLKAIYEKSIQ